MLQRLQHHADDNDQAGTSKGNARSENPIEKERKNTYDRQPACPDENNIVQNLRQIVAGGLAGPDAWNKPALLLHIIGDFKRIKGNRRIEISKEDYQNDVNHKTDGIERLAGFTPVIGAQAFQNMAPYAVSVVARKLTDNDRKLHNGRCENNRDNARRIHFQRNIGGLSAHHFPSLNLLRILNRYLSSRII